MTNRIKDSRVLITGGTGSFGERAIDRFLSGGASQVLIYSRDEYKQSQVQRKYREEPRVCLMLGDVRDETRHVHDVKRAILFQRSEHSRILLTKAARSSQVADGRAEECVG